MNKVPILMPQLGESIAEATVVSFLVNPGDTVESGQEIMEIETNKATMRITAPVAGKLLNWHVQTHQSYPVGSVLGYLESNVTMPAGTIKTENTGTDESHSTQLETPGETKFKKVEPTVRGLPVPAESAAVSFMSPRLKARMNELGLHAADLAGIAGSGAGGRVTIDDFEKFMSSLEKRKLSIASNMRIAVADAMRRSWTRPLATVGRYVKLDAIFEHRKNLTPRPGPTLYAVRALAIALAENSAPAGRLIGNRIVHPDNIDIGFAVEAEDGVLVPVFRNADKRKLIELVHPYNQLIELAKRRQLPADALGGSVATVSNYGTFGLVWATPIPLPEQTLVLGIGAARIVPEWDPQKQEFVPVNQACLTLSFDHRVLDGGAAGRLLEKISQLLNQPDKL
jgi:pyruvate/2-oxoglutarate dehydrogenase complex dihydrolipoamide acyltransferase (E2) component